MAYGYAIAAAIAAAASWQVQAYRYDAKISNITKTAVESQRAALQKLIDANNILQDKKDEAIKVAEEQLFKSRASAAAADSDAGRLRKQLAAANSKLATATQPTTYSYAVTANELLGQCVSEYTKVAAEADGHVITIRLMLGAWPTLGHNTVINNPTESRDERPNN